MNCRNLFGLKIQGCCSEIIFSEVTFFIKPSEMGGGGGNYVEFMVSEKTVRNGEQTIMLSSWFQLEEYRVIHRSLRDIRSLQYSSRDGHAEGEHVNRGTDTPIFCPTLQVFEMSTLLCLSWLLSSRFRTFRRDLWITLYFAVPILVFRLLHHVQWSHSDAASISRVTEFLSRRVWQ